MIRLDPPDRVGGGGAPLLGRLADTAAAGVEVAGLVVFGSTSLPADEAAEVVEGGVICNAGAEHPGPVVVEHGRCSVAVDALDLGEVLPDGDETDVMAADGRAIAREFSKACDVARFIEHHQARVVELAALGRVGVVGRADGLLNQHVEHWPQASLLVGGDVIPLIFVPEPPPVIRNALRC